MEASRDRFILAWAVSAVMRSQAWTWRPFQACCSRRSYVRVQTPRVAGEETHAESGGLVSVPALPEPPCVMLAETSRLSNRDFGSTSVTSEAHLGTPEGLHPLGCREQSQVWCGFCSH